MPRKTAIALAFALAASVATVDAAQAQVPWRWVLGSVVGGWLANNWYHHHYGYGGYGYGPHYGYGGPHYGGYGYGPPRQYYGGYGYGPPRCYHCGGW